MRSRRAIADSAEGHAYTVGTHNRERGTDAELQPGRLTTRQAGDVATTVAGLANAVDQFEKAMQLDPAFSLAYAALADTLTLQVDYGGADRDRPPTVQVSCRRGPSSFSRGSRSSQ